MATSVRGRRLVAASGLVLALGALFATPAYAISIPPAPTQPVNDYTHRLPPEAVARLNEQLRSYELGTTRQMAVAIFPSLDGEDAADFTVRLAEAWKIGSKKNNDGVLITLFLDDRKDFVAVGYGLEGQLTDALSARIRTELMEPRFKAGDYEGGLRAGLAAIDTATGGHQHDEGKLPAASSGGGNRGGGSSSGQLAPILIFIAIFVLISILRRRGGGGGGGGWFIGTGGGGGWSSGGSGGGSSWGGGGGSFGGGGSGGSW